MRLLAKLARLVAADLRAGLKQRQLYLDHCQRAAVLGGVSAGTLKGYQAVRDKHQAFCIKHGIRSWAEVNKTNTEKYGNHLAEKNYADRSIYFDSAP